MARFSNVTSNFSGGLISDHLVGRIDLDRAANSARKFTNFLPTLQGPAEYRPGFELMAEETLAGMTDTVSTSIVLNTELSYRVVFGSQKIKVFDNSGALISTIVSPYLQAELKDLRFSSETDELFITHPNHRPATLSANLGFLSGFILSSVADGGKTLTTTDGFVLSTATEATGLTQWGLADIVTKIEPFLEPDTSDAVMRVEKGEEVAKIVTTDNLSVITSASASDQVNYYIEYDVNGKRVLGKVIRTSTNYPEVVAPAVANGVYTIFVDAEDFVTDITAPNAKLFLLDNAETTSSSIQEKMLIQEGVPDGEVHLRTDVDILNTSTVGTWIRVADDRRSNKVLLGEDAKFGLTRWVKVTEYVGLETHPTTFYSGNQFIEETSETNDYTVYDNGSVYKAFGDSSFDLVDIAETTAAQIRPDANRVFVWNGGEFKGEELLVFHADIARSSDDLTFTVPANHGIKVGDTVNISGLAVGSGSSPNGNQTVDVVTATTIQFNAISGLAADPTGDATLRITTHSNGTTSVVGNLTTAKSLEVVKCDPSATVQLYNGSSNTGGKLFTTTVSNTTVTEIANDATFISSVAIFDSGTDINRHIKGILPSGVVYAKILAFTSTTQVRVRLNSTVPRDSVTGGFENKGVFTEFSLGAWFEDNFPRVVAKFEQRRVYAGTKSNPNFIFLSKINDDQDFAPTQNDKLVLDTDGISYGISNVNASVLWVSAAKDLIFGTSQGVFKLVTNQFNAAVSPKTVRVELVDEIGCRTDGVLAGTSLFFPSDSATDLLEYKFDANIQADTSDNVSKFIYPTFVKDTVKKVEYQNNPQSRLFVITNGGVMYILTYNRAENFYAWSKHETDGTVQDVTVLRRGFDSGIDQVWITVKRGTKYFYERMFSEVDSINEPTYYLDNATKTVNLAIGANVEDGKLFIPATNYTAGDTVSVVVDGVFYGDVTVTQESNATVGDGLKAVVTYSKTTGLAQVAIGKRYTGTLQMMYPTWNAQYKPAFGAETSRIISQKVFTIDSFRFKHGIEGKHAAVSLPGFKILTDVATTTMTPYTGFDRERPMRNAQFGVEKLPELVQDEPYRTIFGSLVTKTEAN